MAKKQIREFLADLENAAEVELKLKQALEDAGCKLFIDDGKDNRYVPKNRLDAKIAELAEANTEIESLQAKVKDPSVAEKEVETLKAKIASMEAEAKNKQLKDAIQAQATQAKARDVDDLMKFLDMDKIKLDEAGKVTGLEEQIKELQEKKAYLFGKVEPQGVPQNPPSFFGTGAPGKPSNLNAFGSKTTHEGDFGKLLGQKVTEEKQQIDSDYFFK